VLAQDVRGLVQTRTPRGLDGVPEASGTCTVALGFSDSLHLFQHPRFSYSSLLQLMTKRFRYIRIQPGAATDVSRRLFRQGRNQM
jgi:hypothetical protein